MRQGRFGATTYSLMEAGIARIPVPDEPVHEDGSGETLGDEHGIVVQSSEELLQQLRTLGLPGHSVRLCLQLVGRDGPSPESLESLRFPEVVLDLGPDHRRASHGFERRSRLRARPNAMRPVHPLYRFLRLDAILEGQLSGLTNGNAETQERRRDHCQQTLFSVQGIPPSNPSLYCVGPPGSIHFRVLECRMLAWRENAPTHAVACVDRVGVVVVAQDGCVHAAGIRVTEVLGTGVVVVAVNLGNDRVVGQLKLTHYQ